MRTDRPSKELDMYQQVDQIKQIVDKAESIVIVQADNPDGDSIGSALALEHILGDLGKKTYLYCAVDVPGYLRYMDGWDRVQKDLPQKFDASIIVDASTMTLFERLSRSGQQGRLASKPCIVLDHHQVVENIVPFATIMINDHLRASTGELIYAIAQELKWPLSVPAQEFITVSILSDTQGLSNQLASAQTYRIVGDMIEAGVDRPKLEEERRELSKMPVEIFKYKSKLIAHTQFDANGKIASVMVPQLEINQYSPLYNPAPLIQSDMLQTVGIQVAIVFKRYDDGKVTAAIRCNPEAAVAAELAEKFGGGGHAFASGFKIAHVKDFDAKRDECIAFATELLASKQDL